MLSAWFLGSIYLVDQRIDVDASTTGGFTAGHYYLRSATASLSMVTDLASQIVAAVGGTCTIRLTRGRTVRITFNTARSVTWGSSTQLRDLLGFTGDLASATTHDAPNVSPLLWSPGYLATPRTIQDVDGYTVLHQSVKKSADGSRSYTAHYGSETWQDLGWTHIMPERLRVADTEDGGGTFHEFFEQCSGIGGQFLYHQEVDELDGSTTEATLDTARGPYVQRERDGDWYRRNVQNAEVSSPLDLPLHLVDEYD